MYKRIKKFHKYFLSSMGVPCISFPHQVSFEAHNDLISFSIFPYNCVVENTETFKEQFRICQIRHMSGRAYCSVTKTIHSS